MRPLGSGLDNTAYETADGLVVRYSKLADPVERAAQVRREAHLLAAVAAWSPLTVPAIESVDAEQGWLAYPKLPGMPLLLVPPADRQAAASRLGTTLGGFLAALHGVPEASVRELVEVDDWPPSEWLAEAREHYAAVAHHVPAEFRPRIEVFLQSPAPEPAAELVFSHNDLGIEHVLVDPASLAVTGVIDWTDAGLTDPARDFGLVHRDLGPSALAAAFAAYGSDRVRARAEFYARCSVFEDLAHGLTTGVAAYVGKCHAAFEWLFPPRY
ncbi:phosphotransferase family protein [Flindersiella endophytica]